MSATRRIPPEACGCLNEGDFSEAEKHVAPDCAVYVNGFAPDLGPEESGPALAEESIEYWRGIVPEAGELTQEIGEKAQMPSSGC